MPTLLRRAQDQPIQFMLYHQYSWHGYAVECSLLLEFREMLSSNQMPTLGPKPPNRDELTDS